MDSVAEKTTNLQAALRALTLHLKNDMAQMIIDTTLVGKFLSTKSFQHFPLKDLILKVWKLKAKVQIEKLENNIFKFIFDNKEDKDYIFNQRPWSFDGSHLILKEWSELTALHEIDFLTSTFHIQVHDLPLAFLHQVTALLIGNQLEL